MDAQAPLASPAPISDFPTTSLGIDPITLNLFARRVYLLFFIQFLWHFFSGWGVFGDFNNTLLHQDSWGIDLGIFALWLLILIVVGCFGRFGRTSPIVWVLYVVFTLATGFLLTGLQVFINASTIFYTVTLFTIISFCLYAASLTGKGLTSFGGASLFLLAGIFIVYEVFLIFTHIVLCTLITMAVVGYLYGLYLNYDVPSILPGSFYRLDPTSDSVAGSIILWLELILSPVRICELVGRNMWRPQAPVALVAPPAVVA